MRRIDANRAGCQPLAAIRRLAGWDVDRAQSDLARARVSLQQAEQDAGDVASQARALADWARTGRTFLQPAVHAQVVHGLGESRRNQERADADCDRRRDLLSSAHQALVMVQARRKALDRVAERIASRMRVVEGGRQARELDEQWLCTHAPGTGR